MKITPASRLAVATRREYDPTKDPTLNILTGLTNRGHGRCTAPGRKHRAVGQHHYRRTIARALRLNAAKQRVAYLAGLAEEAQ